MSVLIKVMSAGLKEFVCPCVIKVSGKNKWSCLSNLDIFKGNDGKLNYDCSDGKCSLLDRMCFYVYE